MEKNSKDGKEVVGILLQMCWLIRWKRVLNREMKLLITNYHSLSINNKDQKLWNLIIIYNNKIIISIKSLKLNRTVINKNNLI